MLLLLDWSCSKSSINSMQKELTQCRPHPGDDEVDEARSSCTATAECCPRRIRRHEHGVVDGDEGDAGEDNNVLGNQSYRDVSRNQIAPIPCRISKETMVSAMEMQKEIEVVFACREREAEPRSYSRTQKKGDAPGRSHIWKRSVAS